MSASRTPAKFFSALAIGAPEPYRQLPVRLERMIHFIPPHNEKIRATLKETIAQVDVVRGVASSRWRASSTSARRGCGRASTA